MPPRTLVRQDVQVGSTSETVDGFDDAILPGPQMEADASSLAQDLNNIRAMLAHLGNLQVGRWYDPLEAPSDLDPGSARGLQQVQRDLHVLERKRILVPLFSQVSVTVPSGGNVVVLGAGQLPTEPTMAVGNVATRGVVVAAHGGTFGQHSLSEVPGASSVAPKNLCAVVDGSTRDPLFSDARRVYGLLQCENMADDHTATSTSPNRIQVSFVRLNAAGNDLEPCPVADIEDVVVNVCFTQRKAFADLAEQDFFLGAEVDLPLGGGGGGPVSSDVVIRRTLLSDLVVASGTTVLQRDMVIPDGLSVTVNDDGELLIL